MEVVAWHFGHSSGLALLSEVITDPSICQPWRQRKGSPQKLRENRACPELRRGFPRVRPFFALIVCSQIDTHTRVPHRTPPNTCLAPILGPINIDRFISSVSKLD